MKKFIVVAVLIAAAYLGGYWPQRRRLSLLQNNVQQMNQQLAQAQTLARLCGIQNRLLDLITQAEAARYGEAQKSSTAFFDQAREEVSRGNTADYVPALLSILSMRDAVTAGLAREDPGTVSMLHQALSKLREAIEQHSKDVGP